MTFRSGRPIVEGKIDGNGPFRFYLDDTRRIGASAESSDLRTTWDLKDRWGSRHPIREETRRTRSPSRPNW